MIANLVCPIFEQPDRDTTWNQLDDVVDKLTSAGFVPVGPQRGRGAVRSRRACPSLRHVIGNVFEHQAHHLDPAIPLCNLVGAQRELASQGCAGPREPGRSATIAGRCAPAGSTTTTATSGPTSMAGPRHRLCSARVDLRTARC